MRLIIIAFIPFITALIGYLLSLKFLNERNFWEDFYFWHKKIKSEINFTQKTIPELINAERRSVFSELLDGYLKTEKLSLPKFLSQEERNFVSDYVHTLGTTDKSSQLFFLNSVENKLSEFNDTHLLKYKKVGPLFIKLGFLFGVIIFILIV